MPPVLLWTAGKEKSVLLLFVEWRKEACSLSCLWPSFCVLSGASFGMKSMMGAAERWDKSFSGPWWQCWTRAFATLLSYWVSRIVRWYISTLGKPVWFRCLLLELKLKFYLIHTVFSLFRSLFFIDIQLNDNVLITTVQWNYRHIFCTAKYT